MRIEELSFGDWVRHTFYEENMQIVRIYGDSERAFAERGKMSISCHLNHFEPIPLTLEILEKNGFEFKHKGLEFDHYDLTLENGMSLLLSFNRDEHYYLMYETKGERGMHQIDCPLGAVHQLQHALRLAGIEKEIEV